MMRCSECGNMDRGKFVAFSVALPGGAEVRNGWRCTECSRFRLEAK
jgi:hypothetical protein